MAEISLQEYCEQIEDTIEQGHYAEAVAHGKHILKHYPKHATTYRLLAQAMLEAGQDEYAADMFRRVLSADPEDLLAWAGMSEVYDRRGELDAAVWYLERAFELATDNKVVEEELRRLYSRRDGIESQRVQLTRGALARLYLRGDLLSRAISELRALLAEHPEQVDLNVALAEALWRNEQRLEASEVCQQVLDELPYCLKANLLLGEIWTSSGREEGQAYLRRAEALDPENHTAQELFGAASPLPERQVRITPLEYKPPTEEERPAWMTEIEAAPAEKPPLTKREAALVDITAALEAQIEIPPWLEEIVDEETAAPIPPGLAEPSEEQPPEEAVPAPAEEVPEWLASIREAPVEEKAEAVAEEEVPEWLAELGLEPTGEEEAPAAPVEEKAEAVAEEEVPEWLAELGPEPTGEEEAPAAPVEAEVPEWLAELGVEVASEEAATPPVEEVAAPPAPAEEAFGWTAFGEPVVPPVAEAPAVEEVPPTEELAPPEVPEVEEVPSIEEITPPEEVPPPSAEEAPLPAWLEGEGMPSGDEALAWLEQLAAGKEEELHAQAEAEAEVRMAEIMGRPKPAEPPLEEAAPEEAAAPPVEEAAAPPAEEAFGWTAFGEIEAPPMAEVPAVEETPPVEEAAPPAVPEGIEAPPMVEVPAVEEALPIEEAAPPAVPEGIEAPPVVEIPVVPVVEEEPLLEEVTALEIRPEEELVPTPVVEEVPGVTEMEVPEPLEEAAAPPEIPTVEAPAEPFAVERDYLKEHPRDYEAWLALAQALWQAGEREEALEAYTRVIRASKSLESVIAALEEHVEQQPDVSTQQVLGDAYMKDGRLQEALDIYRRALEAL